MPKCDSETCDREATLEGTVQPRDANLYKVYRCDNCAATILGLAADTPHEQIEKEWRDTAMGFRPKQKTK